MAMKERNADSSVQPVTFLGSVIRSRFSGGAKDLAWDPSDGSYQRAASAVPMKMGKTIGFSR